ncbi:hypothetical protein AB0L71_08515 [Streptomyces sp. NPDC052052]|uniref:hypothetical protein n=1 Tax=Streptomyces sp. NPDC052052 TaxID=3154756 RepID=UPI00342BF687
MAVLWLEGCGLLVATPLFGVVPDVRSVILLPFVLPALLFVGSLLSAAYVLPSVALGHWLGVCRGDGRRWWWVVLAALLVLVPVMGLPLIGALCVRGAEFRPWQDISAWLLCASALYFVGVPAALAAHRTVVLEDAGRPARSVGPILGYGVLVLLVEWVGVLMVVTG